MPQAKTMSHSALTAKPYSRVQAYVDPTNRELVVDEQNYLKQKTEIISFLAEAKVYDENGDFTSEAQLCAGYDNTKYNKYLKYVSQSDLKAYGAVASTQIDDNGEVILSTRDINTDDGNH